MAGIGNHIMFLVIFLGLAATYGLSSSTALQNQFNSLVATINAPLPPPPPLSLGTPQQACAFGDIGCAIAHFAGNAQQLLAPLAVIGGAMVWFFQVLFAFITKITAIGTLIPLLSFGTLDVAGTVPFGNYIMIGTGLIVILEIVRIIRGSSASGV